MSAEIQQPQSEQGTTSQSSPETMPPKNHFPHWKQKLAALLVLFAGTIELVKSTFPLATSDVLKEIVSSPLFTGGNEDNPFFSTCAGNQLNTPLGEACSSTDLVLYKLSQVGISVEPSHNPKASQVTEIGTGVLEAIERIPYATAFMNGTKIKVMGGLEETPIIPINQEEVPVYNEEDHSIKVTPNSSDSKLDLPFTVYSEDGVIFIHPNSEATEDYSAKDKSMMALVAYIANGDLSTEEIIKLSEMLNYYSSHNASPENSELRNRWRKILQDRMAVEVNKQNVFISFLKQHNLSIPEDVDPINYQQAYNDIDQHIKSFCEGYAVGEPGSNVNQELLNLIKENNLWDTFINLNNLIKNVILPNINDPEAGHDTIYSMMNLIRQELYRQNGDPRRFIPPEYTLLLANLRMEISQLDLNPVAHATTAPEQEEKVRILAQLNNILARLDSALLAAHPNSRMYTEQPEEIDPLGRILRYSEPNVISNLLIFNSDLSPNRFRNLLQMLVNGNSLNLSQEKLIETGKFLESTQDVFIQQGLSMIKARDLLIAHLAKNNINLEMPVGHTPIDKTIFEGNLHRWLNKLIEGKYPDDLTIDYYEEALSAMDSNSQWLGFLTETLPSQMDSIIGPDASNPDPVGISTLRIIFANYFHGSLADNSFTMGQIVILLQQYSGTDPDSTQYINLLVDQIIQPMIEEADSRDREIPRRRRIRRLGTALKRNREVYTRDASGRLRKPKAPVQEISERNDLLAVSDEISQAFYNYLIQHHFDLDIMDYEQYQQLLGLRPDTTGIYANLFQNYITSPEGLSFTINQLIENNNRGILKQLALNLISQSSDLQTTRKIFKNYQQSLKAEARQQGISFRKRRQLTIALGDLFNELFGPPAQSDSSGINPNNSQSGRPRQWTNPITPLSNGQGQLMQAA